MTQTMKELIWGTHVRILKTDGKETQGNLLSADDHMVMIDSNTITRIIPWTSIVYLTVMLNKHIPQDTPRTP